MHMTLAVSAYLLLITLGVPWTESATWRAFHWQLPPDSALHIHRQLYPARSACEVRATCMFRSPAVSTFVLPSTRVWLYSSTLLYVSY